MNNRPLKTLFRARILVVVLTIALLSGCGIAQTSGTRLVRIGILNVNNATEQTRQAFINGMKALGYDEDKGTAKIIWKGEANTTDQVKIKEKLAEIMAEKPDLLFVMNTAIAVAASAPDTNIKIPIVFAAVYDPLPSKIVLDRVRPGKNITGIMHGISEAKRTEWFTRIAPNARRYYVPYNPKDASAVQSLTDIKSAAGKLGITIIERPCIADLSKNCTAADVINLFDNVPPDADAIMCPADPTIVGQIKKITEVSFARKLPVSVIGHPDVQSGALFSYGFNFVKIGPQAARIADQILKGVSPGDIPIEAAELDLFINLSTADKIGLLIPPNVLNSANVILRGTLGSPTAPAVGTLPATATISASTPTALAATVTAIPATITAPAPTATDIPPTATTLPPTLTPAPATTTPNPPTNTLVPPTATAIPSTETPRPPTESATP